MDAHKLGELRGKMATMEKDLKKSLDFQMGQLSNILKQTEVKKEKKGKVNKKEATMFLMNDDSVKIIFADSNDGIKFFEGIK